jgi:hypothetical protein
MLRIGRVLAGFGVALQRVLDTLTSIGFLRG